MPETDRKYQRPFPDVTTWISAPCSLSRCMTAWHRVEFPSPKPFTRKRMRAFGITHDVIGRQSRMAALGPLSKCANPTGALPLRTSRNRTNECSSHDPDETVDTDSRRCLHAAPE